MTSTIVKNTHHYNLPLENPQLFSFQIQLISNRPCLRDYPHIFINCKAKEIVYLVASIRQSVRPSVCLSVCLSNLSRMNGLTKIFVCVSTNCADAVDRLLIFTIVIVILFPKPQENRQTEATKYLISLLCQNYLVDKIETSGLTENFGERFLNSYEDLIGVH